MPTGPRTALLLALLLPPATTPPPAHPHVGADRKTVAVLAFDNHTGRTDYDALGKGLSAMMATDLQAVEAIQVVERERLADVTRELDRQRTRYFDSTTAVAVGRLSGAEYIITGAIASAQPQVRLDTRVIHVATGAIVKAAQVTGHEDRFFDLQQRLSRQLVKDLDIALDPDAERRLAARQEANRIEAMSTLVSLSQALALADYGDYVGASAKMVPVVRAAPNAMVVRVAADEFKRKAAARTANDTKQKVNTKVGDLIRRKWPPR